jgi:hypothetical protein
MIVSGAAPARCFAALELATGKMAVCNPRHRRTELRKVLGTGRQGLPAPLATYRGWQPLHPTNTANI